MRPDLLSAPTATLWAWVRARWEIILGRSGVRWDARLPASPSLLTRDQAKLDKGRAHGYLTAGLQLAPERESFRPETTGTMCPLAGACARSCVKGMGQNAFGNAQLGRAWRTALYRAEPEMFGELLARELSTFRDYAVRNGYRAAARLNTISDVNWRPFLNAHADRLRGITLYDYTKVPGRAMREHVRRDGGIPWHLVYSVSERSRPARVTGMVRRGVTVSVVTTRAKGTPPKKARRYGGPCVDGDAHDLTFLWAPGTVLDLSFKSARNVAEKRAEAVRAGFCKA